MERHGSRLASGLALPALVWAFAFERVTARRRGLPARINGGQVTLNGDDWHFGISEDATHVVVIHERAAREAAEGHNKILRLNEEKDQLLPMSKAQWADNNPDAKRLAERQTKAVKRLKEIEKEIQSIEAAANEAGSERLEVSLEELSELMTGTVRIAPPTDAPEPKSRARGTKADPDLTLADAEAMVTKALDVAEWGPDVDAMRGRLLAVLKVPATPGDGNSSTADEDPPESYVVEGLSAPQLEALTEAFPTLEALKEASDEEILNVATIGDATLGKIREWLAKPAEADGGAEE